MADLKPVYKAETVKAAEIALDALEEKGELNTQSSLNHGVKNGPFVGLLQICRRDRRVIYTTNAIEAVPGQLRCANRAGPERERTLFIMREG